MAASVSNPYAILRKKKHLNAVFKRTNPNKECSLPDDVYVSIVTKIEAFVISKANEEPTFAIRAIGNFICNAEGTQEGIFGQGMSLVFVIRETENQTEERAFENFVFFIQDCLGINTDGMSIDTLENDIPAINEMLKMPTSADDQDHGGPAFVRVVVKTSDAGRKNVNARIGLSGDDLMQMGLDGAMLLDQFSTSEPTTADEGDAGSAEAMAPEPEPEPEPIPAPAAPPARPAPPAPPARSTPPASAPAKVPGRNIFKR